MYFVFVKRVLAYWERPSSHILWRMPLLASYAGNILRYAMSQHSNICIWDVAALSAQTLDSMQILRNSRTI